MSAVVASVGRPAPAAVSCAGAARGTAASLVPEADSPSAAGITDALGLLYVAMAEQGQNSLQTGQAEVKSGETAEKKALTDQQAALQRQENDQANHGRGFFSSIGHLLGDVTKDTCEGRLGKAFEDGAKDVKDAVNSPAFWHDLEKGALAVAKVAAVVGSAALTVSTVGAGGIAVAGAALALSAGGDVVSETKVFGDKASAWVGLGMNVAGVVGGGIGALAPAATNAALKGLVTAGEIANGVAGASTVVGGGAHIQNAGFEANAEGAGADAKQALSHDQEDQQQVGWVTDDLKTSSRSNQDALQTIQSAIQTRDQAATIAAASISVKG